MPYVVRARSKNRVQETVVEKMKEIHAYRNEDGTYRVEGIGYAMDKGGASKEVVVRIPRAKVDVEALVVEGSKEIYSIEVKEN
jgi:hypothetical protein